MSRSEEVNRDDDDDFVIDELGFIGQVGNMRVGERFYQVLA